MRPELHTARVSLQHRIFRTIDARLPPIVEIEIRRARPDEAAGLTEIAHAAKRHWGYPEKWIDQWKEDLTITTDFIATHEVFVALIEGEVVGCCALVVTGALAELEHLWISPKHIGSGVGRALFAHVKARTVKLNLRGLEISSDPNAEGFYERMGAVRIGDLRSEIDGQLRILPRMRVDL